ncbi:hypothetical protein ONZ45_g5023 [Pleurotus djamor]|nr:hypothetical protein ONZ45_g5023 [Pleurotus djamor]
MGGKASKRKPVDIIVLLGPTGAGKSTVRICTANPIISVLKSWNKFGNLALGDDIFKTGNSLGCCTNDVQIHACKSPEDGRQVLIIDTPAFNHDTLSIGDIETKVKKQLKKKKTLHVTGILYLHRISDVRLNEDPIRHLRMFEELCGPQPARKIILATTMWQNISQVEGNRREAELRRHWQHFITQGSHVLNQNISHIPICVLDVERRGLTKFINTAIGKQKLKCEEGNRLEPVTKEVKDVKHKDLMKNREFIFIDTPGLDVMEPADMKDEADKRCANVDAIIYLHRVSDPRVTTPPEKSLKVLQMLGGADWEKKSIVVMTMCDRVEQEKADKREKEFLTSFWRVPQERGAKKDRFRDKSYEDAWRVIDQLVPPITETA